MNKVFSSAEEAIADIKSGSVIALGGFFTAGSPTVLIKALAKSKAKNLTLIAQSAGVGNIEVNELVENGQIAKVIANYPFFRSATKGKDRKFEQLVRSGDIKVETYPMGTFIDKLRCAAGGLAAFYTPTAAGTDVADGKETRVFDGKEYVLELALRPDYAFVHAFQADAEGNVVYRKTARNYNPAMAMAARTTIAEVENIVEIGELDPDKIHTPGIFVHRVVKVDRPVIVPGID